MISYYHAIREVSGNIAGAIERSIVALGRQRVEHEPAMTDRMLGAIEESLHGFISKGIEWSAKTLTDRGPGSQESKFGADFMGVLNITLPDYKVAKGFLAQAKLVRDDGIDDVDELKRQCRKMLQLTSHAFVFLYDKESVRVVPAIAVLGTEDPLALYHRSAQRFFEEHLQCFIGDGEIKAATPQQLKILRDRFEARSALLIKAESAI